MKKATARYSIVLLVLGIFTSGLFAAGVDLTGVGARATNLGGNYRAISNDWSGMFWNPAGLVFSKGLHAGASLEFIKATVGYSAANYGSGAFSGTSAQSIENDPKTYLIPAGGVYYSTEKFAVGLGFWAPFGLGAKWDLLNTSSYNSAYPTFDWEDDLKVVAVQPTFALKLNDKLSVGAGVSFLMADIMIRKPNFTPNPYIYGTAAPLGAYLPAAAKAAPYDHILTDTDLQGDGTGWGATLGLTWKPTETLSLGASMRYYSTVALDGEVNATTYLPNNAQANTVVLTGIKPTLDGMLAGKMISQADYMSLLGMYSGAKSETYKNLKIKADMPLPMNIGAGFAYTGIHNLLISGDVAMTQWSAWDVIDIVDENGKTVSALKENWKDGIRMGLGLEYSLGFAKLRGSFYSEPRAVVDASMAPTVPDVNRRNVALIGVGIPLGPIQIQALYEKMFIGDATVSEWVVGNMAGVYSANINNFMFGIDYSF